MIKVYEKTILWWICPSCGERNEVEDREDRAIPDELECDNCDFVGTWELGE